MLLIYVALALVETVEILRYEPPVAWEKLLGLDRIPVAKTLCQNVALLSDRPRPTNWMVELCRYWMGSVPELAGVLYVDGHVRVYHGQQTRLTVSVRPSASSNL